MESRLSPAERLATLPWLLGLGWTLLILGIFFLEQHQEGRHHQALITQRALNQFERDAATRSWASKHGGVYVPISERTPPNPHLANISHRELPGPGSVTLTLMNPAYILRQMAEEYPDQDIVRHITSLKPIRPENAPDTWETSALKAFDRGIPEVVEFTERNNQPWFRFMRPFITEKGCIKCHPDYTVGAIRGGISVSISLASHTVFLAQRFRLGLLSFGCLWLIGIGFLGFVYTRQRHLLHVLEEMNAEKAQLSKQLAQSQKLEAIGTLAGGIAHDFNNLLTVILGNLDIILMDCPDDSQCSAELTAIQRSAQKARAITQKLLGFSRRKQAKLQSVDLNQLLRDLGVTLSPLIGADFPVTYRFGEGLPAIQADPGEVEQVVMNLLVNARDAVRTAVQANPERSRLILVETRAVSHEEGLLNRKQELPSGPYVLMTITDNGTGMTPEVQQRVFEPFFTTKEVGKGTGLGLATTWGIIRQHHGTITVYSEPGSGTTIRVYWPLAHLPAATAATPTSPKEIPADLRGTERILVVDDEPDVRIFAGQALRGFGYRTSEAATGREALAIITNMPTDIDLIVSDVIMPEMNGTALVKELRRLGLHHPVLLVSGYSAELVGPDTLGPQVEFLQKPVSPRELATQVRKLLDQVKTAVPTP